MLLTRLFVSLFDFSFSYLASFITCITYFELFPSLSSVYLQSITLLNIIFLPLLSLYSLSSSSLSYLSSFTGTAYFSVTFPSLSSSGLSPLYHSLFLTYYYPFFLFILPCLSYFCLHAMLIFSYISFSFFLWFISTVSFSLLNPISPPLLSLYSLSSPLF